jgi:hypothetical protein
MHIPLDVPVGHWRELSTNELEDLQKRISTSTKVSRNIKPTVTKKQRPKNKKALDKSGKSTTKTRLKRAKSQKKPHAKSQNSQRP